MSDNNNDKTNSNESSFPQVPPSLNEFTDLMNRTLRFTTQGINSFLNGSGWSDSIGETINSTIPSILLGSGNANADYQDVWASDKVVTSDHEVPLDTTKPRNLWAYPVPSTNQYAKCKDMNGTSVWTREGVWRCLFPQSANLLGLELNKSTEKENRQLFGTYNGYLDWKVYMRKLEQEKANLRREELQKQWQENHARFSTSSEATPDNGKVVTSTQVSTSTYTKEDGSLETKKVVQKWYSDGTTSTIETVSNGKDDSGSGWFWK